MSPRPQTPRQRAYELMQDGREDVYLAEFARHAASWSQDAYLVLRRADALWRLDRLGEAEAAYRSVSSLRTATAAERAEAQRQLQRLESEWKMIEVGRASLGRARLGIGAGVVGLGAVALVTWLWARRNSRTVGES